MDIVLPSENQILGDSLVKRLILVTLMLLHFLITTQLLGALNLGIATVSHGSSYLPSRYTIGVAGASILLSQVVSWQTFLKYAIPTISIYSLTYIQNKIPPKASMLSAFYGTLSQTLSMALVMPLAYEWQSYLQHEFFGLLEKTENADGNSENLKSKENENFESGYRRMNVAYSSQSQMYRNTQALALMTLSEGFNLIRTHMEKGNRGEAKKIMAELIVRMRLTFKDIPLEGKFPCQLAATRLSHHKEIWDPDFIPAVLEDISLFDEDFLLYAADDRKVLQFWQTCL